MQIRCPNCRQPIRFGEFSDDQHEIECPSCHSQISLSRENESSKTLAEGHRFGHYEIRGLLGQGGYGSVYRAWDSELERFVALKIPRDRSKARANAQAFLREARTAANITHANVVSVFEVGIHDEPYIASQFVDGKTLSKHMHEKSMLPQQAAQLMIQILSGLQALHDCDIIHRDMKPSNVLLDESGQPMVNDFGLAKEVLPDGVTVTLEGRIVGTLNYMSPEQAAGNHRELGPGTDIFSCGVILYELLTGKLPHQSNSAKTLVQTIASDEPPPLRNFNAKISSDLQTICQKALANKPQDRYQSANEFAEDLENYLENRPINARREGIVKRCSRWMSRNRVLAASLTLTSVLLIAFGFLSKSLLHATDPTLVPIRIDTMPSSQVEFTLYDAETHLPDISGFSESGASGSKLYLEPGLYKVKAVSQDGKFHEVWRTVPEKNTTISVLTPFLHKNYELLESGTAELPRIQLHSNKDIPADMALLTGGTFQFGYEDNPRKTSTKHFHNVEDFWVARDEVSWGLFRKVMKLPHYRRMDKTHLDEIDERYGSRAESPENAPATGYPYDVWVLFAELAGGRLPTHVEYEYAATQGGTSRFPSGPEPINGPTDDWKILKVDEATRDVTKEGIKNLYSGVGEFTDSSMLPYTMLYADRFSELPPELAGSSTGSFSAIFKTMRDIRGAPPRWLQKNMQEPTRNVGVRFGYPVGVVGGRQSEQYYERIGLRLYRSAKP